MEHEIATLEEQLREAMLASDVATLEALISPDLVFVNHFGAVLSREEDLAPHRSGALRFHRLDPSERRILMLQQAAFAGVRVHLAGVFNGSPFQEDLQFSRLWQRHASGAWQIVAGQATRVQAPAPPSS
ncbi:nuclear transport factor 2 family protein [Cyanobium gracile UHCC 0139]|uniref:Nuclear transport factor 2 family protein n=1 Tax=Cyanobium gracile UHCC 0139 TaxID=3110308 RepID=A0ABU5RU63_9CYAN|nr:nuclear transport factor 2 family protein [Cyanobium gracile]MEA5391287.1 nuclear transport factor 2 family protein [Cyanobium gracile UHCC 0139]